MTKTLITLSALIIFVGPLPTASAESCPPTSRVLLHITGDDSFDYLTSRISLDTAEDALGTSWSANANALAANAFRVARLQTLLPPEPVSAVNLSPAGVTGSEQISPAASATTSAAIALPATPNPRQPASAPATGATLQLHPAISTIRMR